MVRYIAILMGVTGLLFLGNAGAGEFGGWHERGNAGWNFKGWHKGRDDSGLSFEARLTGEQEVTDAMGGVDTDRMARAIATFDEGFTELRVRVKFNDSEDVVAVHFHCGRAGQNGPVALGLISPGPLGVENDMIRGTLTNMEFTGADCESVVGRPVNNLAALAMAMRDGLVYLNVHTPDFPAGEIRGQMLER
jgi:hypothetical protein